MLAQTHFQTHIQTTIAKPITPSPQIKLHPQLKRTNNHSKIQIPFSNPQTQTQIIFFFFQNPKTPKRKLDPQTHKQASNKTGNFHKSKSNGKIKIK